MCRIFLKLAFSGHDTVAGIQVGPDNSRKLLLIQIFKFDQNEALRRLTAVRHSREMEEVCGLSDAMMAFGWQPRLAK